MPTFILSGFADEISIDFDQQLDGLRSLGIQYIEVRMVDGKSIVEYACSEVRALKARLDAAGIRVSSVGSPIGKSLITDGFDACLSLFRHTLDIADILDTPYIRMFSFYIPKDGTRAQYREEVLRRLKIFVAEAESRNITLLHENEAGIYGEGAESCADLFDSIPSKHFRAVFDPANFVFAGIEVFPFAYGLLKDRIHYLHIKDAIRKPDGIEITPAGEGGGKIAEVLKALWDEGFSGFLSIEPHLHDVFTRQDVFTAYKAAKERGETGEAYVGDGLAQFKRAYDALDGILKEVMA